MRQWRTVRQWDALAFMNLTCAWGKGPSILAFDALLSIDGEDSR